MMRKLEEMEQAFKSVKDSAEKGAAGDKVAKERAFEEIFALNNVIGRLGRENPKAMPKMKELQGYVNVITVGLKHARAREVSEGLSAVDKSIKTLKRELA